MICNVSSFQRKAVPLAVARTMAEQDAAAKAVEKLTVSSQPVRVAAAVLQRHQQSPV
jgi:hypothetical protein